MVHLFSLLRRPAIQQRACQPAVSRWPLLLGFVLGIWLSFALYRIFPFAYQAGPWINNFFYPLSDFILLAMAASWRRSRPCSSSATTT
jgi:hypothetical protein